MDSLLALRGTSPSMQRLYASVLRVAPSGAAVLIRGESGSGKELVAQAIHALSPRASGPFVTFDCGATPPTLIATELFGHERGSFTGAERQHVGAFERAQGGTFFLDEIGELPAAEQATLLGVLERKKYRRVGGRDELSLDVRVIAATHRDLRGEAEAQRFRLDLFFRLAVVTLSVPPLRERAGDIGLLAEHFLRELGFKGAVDEVIGAERMARFLEHDWPGNVRELRNVVEATLLGEGPDSASGTQRTSTADISADWLDAVVGLPYKEARATVMQRFESRYLAGLLARSEKNVSQAARLAQMDRSYLLELLRRHALWRQ